MAGTKLSIKIPARPRSRDIAPIIQRQWLQHLGIQVSLSEVEQTVWEQDLTFKRYEHVIEESWSAFCEDPSDFLTFFGPSRFAATTWTEPGFDRDFTAANRLPDAAERIKALAACEVQLIKAMPVIPIFHDSWAYLEAPFLRGVQHNPFGSPRFKYAWIDKGGGHNDPRMTRRSLFTASPLMLASCASRDAYFGRTQPPQRQRLVFHIGAEPETLDPVMSKPAPRNSFCHRCSRD